MPWADGAAPEFNRASWHFLSGTKARRTGRASGITVFLYAALVLSGGIEAQTRPTRRVLILNETGTSYPAINTIDQGIRVGLQDAPYRLEFYREYLETVLFPDSETQREFRDFYLRKYHNRKPDVIIAVGPSPLEFILKTHERAFAGVPVIFYLPYGPLPGTLRLDPGITGMTNVVEPAATLEIALRLKPETKHVIIIGGTSALDRQTEEEIQQGLRSYANRLDISYLTNLTMPVLLTRLRHAPRDAIILFSGITQDAAGTPFLGSESAPMVTAAASAPVFVLTDSFLGHGEVGGKLVTRFEQGKVIGNMALKVLTGEKPQDIPVVNGVTQYMFDWRALRRWGLSEAKLPAGSAVLNRERSFWGTYGRYVLLGLSILLAQTLLIMALLIQRQRRKESQKLLLWRLEFESLLSDLSTTFISLPANEVDTHIEAGLARIGKFLEMSRITIFELSQDGTEFHPISAWNAPGISKAPLTMSTTHLPWWRDQILSGKVSLMWRLEDLPEEASVEKEFFRQRGVLSAASIPLTISGEITGAITFVCVTHQVLWTKDLVNQLKVIGDIFCNALKRKRATLTLLATQATLCESEERFRLTMSNVATGVYTLDLQGLVTYVNPAAEKMFGWTNAELLGKKMYDVTHYSTPFPASDCEWLQVFQNGIELREQEDMFNRKDGSFFPVVYSVSPLKRGTETVGLVVGFRDDTERREAERAVGQSEHELLEAQRLAHVGRWFWDAENDIVTWSEELYRIAGRDPSSRAPSYKEHQQLFTPESWARLNAAVEHALRSGEFYELDLEMVRPDGTIRWITARGEAVCDADDLSVGLRGTVQDITEYKQAEEVLSTMSQKLIQAQEHERASIGRELHDDINQRIALAAVTLKGLEHERAASVHELKNGIADVSRQLVELGGDVETLSHRLHSSKLENLGLRKGAASFCREFSDRHKVKVDFETANVPDDLRMDVSLSLFRVLQEAMQNAIKHSGSGRIQVRLNAGPDGIELTVCDSGVGFTPQATMTKGGIGLHSMQERLKLVNGHLSIDSQPQQGTTIKASVPLSPRRKSMGVA
jgi:PAS domain S-box-containing protein